VGRGVEEVESRDVVYEASVCDGHLVNLCAGGYVAGFDMFSITECGSCEAPPLGNVAGGACGFVR
jgi:hypothetical protein